MIVCASMLIGGVLLWSILQSTPYECPACGRWIAEWDHCEWCGWEIDKGDK